MGAQAVGKRPQSPLALFLLVALTGLGTARGFIHPPSSVLRAASLNGLRRSNTGFLQATLEEENGGGSRPPPSQPSPSIDQETEGSLPRQEETQAKPKNYYKDIAIMAEEAARMPINFFNRPELAYYPVGDDGMKLCRLITGTWQLDGKHGYRPMYHEVRRPIYDLVRLDGYTTFDMAPFYGEVESWVGKLMADILDPKEKSAYRLLTKLVPPPMVEDKDVTLSAVEAQVDQSLARLKAERLDIMQLHWWNFNDTRYLDVLDHLQILQEKGKVRHIGVTNFPATALEKALDHGVPIVSNQVQLSILDQRPLHSGLAQLCQERNVTLLCYGALMGGFLTDQWLGADEPDPKAFENVSEEKYYAMIKAWGTWEAFQEVLHELRSIARKHKTTIAHVAMRWVVDRPAVGSVIVGTRLGYVTHQQANKDVLRIRLTTSDRENIWRAHGLGKGRSALMEAYGDVGGEYKAVIGRRWERAPRITSAWSALDKGFMPQGIVDLGTEVL